eukprot:scaffold426445_cov45-Prasinocladus_malaysianus.AAC.1
MAGLLAPTTSSDPKRPTVALARRLARTMNGDVIVQTSFTDVLCLTILLPTVEAAGDVSSTVVAKIENGRSSTDSGSSTVVDIPAITA